MKMSNEDRKCLEQEVIKIIECAVSRDYSRYILEHIGSTGSTFVEGVVNNVLETSAWEDEGYYSESDIKLAIGRELMVRLGVEF